MKMDLNKLREIATILNEENIEEFELQEKDFYIRLLRSSTSNSMNTEPAISQTTIHAKKDEEIEVSQSNQEPDEGNKFITSPIVGTFYRAPSPDADPFVEVGSKLQKGQVMCIIEAMKLMNELEADYPCEVKKILIENGQSVEYGEPIIEVKPL